jgi:hypothetical protein
LIIWFHSAWVSACWCIEQQIVVNFANVHTKRSRKLDCISQFHWFSIKYKTLRK